MLNESDGVWTITRSYLERGDRDVQDVVNCTREGDRVVFQAGETFKLTHRIEIPWNLTLSSTGSANSTRSQQHEGAVLRCRPGEGAFLIRFVSPLSVASEHDGVSFQIWRCCVGEHHV